MVGLSSKKISGKLHAGNKGGGANSGLLSKVLKSFLCLCLAVSAGATIFSSFAFGKVDIGPVTSGKPIEIALRMPSNDSTKTFADYKQDLTNQLLAKGFTRDQFKIIDSAKSINTSDLSGWNIYDHYYSQDAYNSLGLSSEQKAIQPFRQAIGVENEAAPLRTMEQVFGENGMYSPTALQNPSLSLICQQTKSHIWNYTDSSTNLTNMVFSGYYKSNTTDVTDYMIFPAETSRRRTVDFDIDATQFNTHTLFGFGYLLNAGVSGDASSGDLNGYVLYFLPKPLQASTPSGVSQEMSVHLLKLKPGAKANLGALFTQTNGTYDETFNDFNSNLCTKVASAKVDLGSQKKGHISIDLRKDQVTVQLAAYDSTGTTGQIQNLITAQQIEDTGYNGFGPYVQYATGGHTCTSLSIFKFLNLEMKYDDSAFEALKTINFSNDSQYRYFINLKQLNDAMGLEPENAADLPDQVNDKSEWKNGIFTMDANEIFYMSNKDDGGVLQNPSAAEEKWGIGDANGYYVLGEDYLERMADRIKEDFDTGNWMD